MCLQYVLIMIAIINIIDTQNKGKLILIKSISFCDYFSGQLITQISDILEQIWWMVKRDLQKAITIKDPLESLMIIMNVCEDDKHRNCAWNEHLSSSYNVHLFVHFIYDKEKLIFFYWYQWFWFFFLQSSKLKVFIILMKMKRQDLLWICFLHICWWKQILLIDCFIKRCLFIYFIIIFFIFHQHFVFVLSYRQFKFIFFSLSLSNDCCWWNCFSLSFTRQK